MTTLQLSARCTREEYMEYCVHRHKKQPLLLVAGAIFIGLAAISYAFQQQMTQTGWLLVLLGMICATLDGLWLPMFRKGEAARRYDASDTLQQAIRLTCEETMWTVQTADHEGTLPLSLVTAVEQTEAMLAILFGAELTVLIPKRALEEDELAFLLRTLQRKE